MAERTKDEWIGLVHTLGPEFEARAEAADRDDAFVAENYAALKVHRFFAAGIPAELGGEGVPYPVLCGMLETMAGYCGSTALAHSMHQHLVAANVWKYRRGQGGDEMLKRVAANQPVLVSTGASDWLESNGTMVKAGSGYVVNATKRFASQSAAGDILVTSAPYDDPVLGAQVLHFPVPVSSPGVKVLDDWRALGMRGTGSRTVRLRDVHVPEAAITLRRPRGEFHPFWNVVLGVAMPLIMSVYLGIARKAARIATGRVKEQQRVRPFVVSAVGAMHNDLTAAEVHVRDMVRLAGHHDFAASDELGQAILSRKTNAVNACIGVVGKAMDIVGGQGFYRDFGLERLFRDVQAARYHPLQEKHQQHFTGEYLLGRPAGA